MILGSSKTHVVEEVFRVVEGHIDAKLPKDAHEGLMRDQVTLPALQLSLALKAQTIESLWLYTMSLEELQDSGKQLFGVTWVSVYAPSQAIQYHVLLLSGIL